MGRFIPLCSKCWFASSGSKCLRHYRIV